MSIKVSIIIPTYNSEKYISKCLDSILLNKFYKNLEVIIVDNKSSDKTLKKILRFKKKLNIKIIKNKKNMERSYSRNYGFLNSKGNYVTFLDSDDVFKKNFFEEFYKFINGDKKKNKIFFSIYETRNKNKKKISNFFKQKCTINDLIHKNNLPNIGIILDREVCKNIRWDENKKLIGFEDYDFYMRAIMKYNQAIRFSDKPICIINNHKFRSVHSLKKEVKLLNQIDYFEKKILYNQNYKKLASSQKNKIISTALLAISEEVLNIKKFNFFFKIIFKSFKLNFMIIFNKRFIFLVYYFFRKYLI